MTTISKLPSPILNYVGAFDLACIARTRDARFYVTRNPAGAESAWWCEAVLAGALARAVRSGEDVPVAAARLGIAISDHATVARRASAAVARIEAALQQAEAGGDMKFFNTEYRRRRQAARRRGQGFITYNRARARLGEAIAGAAATGTLDRTLVAAVFE